MSKSAPFSKFAPIAVPVYLAALLVAVLVTPYMASYVSQRSAAYAEAATKTADTSKQIGYYRLAVSLSPQKAEYRVALADLYLKQGNIQTAIDALGATFEERLKKAELLLGLGKYEQAMQGLAGLKGPQAAILGSKIALEQGSEQKAYRLVQDARNDAERLQLGLSYAALGNAEQAKRLLPMFKDSSSRNRLERASSGGVALAGELYKEKLYLSAERVLIKAGESAEKYLLLAHVQLKKPLTSGKTPRQKLEAARDTALKGISHNPASIKLHELLRTTYHQLEDKNGITREEQTIRKLRNGRL